MAKCDPFHFEGITAEAFLQISKELAAKGFPISGSAGEVHGPFGIVIQYAWDAHSQVLTVEVLDKNFFISCNQIKEQLMDALGKYTARQ